MPVTHNHAVNHVAIAVPDCEAAMEFYTTIFGFRALRDSPRMTDRAETPGGPIFKIYDKKLQKVKTAFLVGGNGVGVELFEFVDPKMEEPATFNYTRGGFFHIGITDPEPDELCKKVIAKGGKQIGETITLYGSEKALYLEDPWGNTIEVLTCSFEQLLANRC